MVTRLTFKGLLAHKLRFLMATLSVVLGVGFVTGTFVLTDSLRATFDSLFEETTANLDVQVRSVLAFGDPATTTRDPLPADLLDVVRDVPGVAEAQGSIQRSATIIGRDGEAVTTTGAPTLGLSLSAGRLTGVTVRDGRLPTGADEVALDAATAEREDFAVGDEVEVGVPSGRLTFTVAGLVGQGDAKGFAGATVVGWAPEVAQEVLDAEGTWDTIDVAVDDGADPSGVRDAISDVLPPGVEAADRDTVVEETKDAVDSFLSVFGNALLGFAFVALFVSAFIINNTFAIIVGQRIRELALLRAVGAGAGQVRRLVLSEALAVGVLASILGIPLGIAIAKGIIAAFNAAGAGFPSTGTVLALRTWVFALVVGIGVTMLASLIPARRASRVPPVAAMRAELGFVELGSRRRLVVGAVVAALGVVLLGIGLFIEPGGTAGTIGTAAVGAVALFIGVASLSTTVAGPVARAVGWPISRLFKLPGHLATENAARSPRRTSATASALMIGLALVSTFSVVGASVKQTFSDILEDSVQADFFMTEPSFVGFPATFTERLAQRPEFAAVSGFRLGRFQVDGSTKDVGAVDPLQMGRIVDIDVQEGRLEDLGDDGVLVHEDPARDLRLEIGSPLDVTWPNGRQQTLTVKGVYGDASLAGNWVVSTATLEANTTAPPVDIFAGAVLAPDVDAQAGRAAIEEVAADYPQVRVDDRAEFRDRQEGQIDQSLVVINLLLGLAVVIALIGIANTLALSVFERTRELGLLRAVGMSRRQVRRMVRWESVVVALFGAVLGVVIGAPLGVALCAALPESLVQSIAFPVGQIVVLLVVAVVAGVLAAIFPARRAARMDVLHAIASE